MRVEPRERTKLTFSDKLMVSGLMTIFILKSFTLINDANIYIKRKRVYLVLNRKNDRL